MTKQLQPSRKTHYCRSTRYHYNLYPKNTNTRRRMQLQPSRKTHYCRSIRDHHNLYSQNKKYSTAHVHMRFWIRNYAKRCFFTATLSSIKRESATCPSDSGNAKSCNCSLTKLIAGQTCVSHHNAWQSPAVVKLWITLAVLQKRYRPPDASYSDMGKTAQFFCHDDRRAC